MQLNFNVSTNQPSAEPTDDYQTENTLASTSVQQSRSNNFDHNRSVERSEMSGQQSQNQQEHHSVQRSNKNTMNINEPYDNTLDVEIKTIPAHSLIFLQNQLKIENFKKNLPQVRRQQRTNSIQKSELISNQRIFSPNSFNENQEDVPQVMTPQNFQQTFITSPTFKSFTRLEPIRKKDQVRYANLDQIYTKYKERSYALQFQKDPFKVLKNAQKDIILLNDMFLQDSSLGQSINPESLILLIENGLLKLQEQKSWRRNTINIDDQINEASFIFRRVIHAINEKSNSSCNCQKNFDLFAVALSMLWNFIVTSVDIILFKQQDEIDEFKVKEEEMVEQKVSLFRSKYEQKIYGLNCLIEELRDQITKLQNKNQQKKEEIHTLKHKLQQETELVQSFKDPEGMAKFRMVLQDMENDIKYLAKEKESQYKSMRQSLRLMEDLTVQRNDVIYNEQIKNQARDVQITEFKRQIQHLQSKMEELEDQASKNQNALVWVSRPKRPAKKQGPALEAQQQTLTELQILINKSGLTQDELDAMRMQMLQEVEEQIAWETEMRLREEFKFYIKRVQQDQEKKNKESKGKDQPNLSQLVDSFFQMNNIDLHTLRILQKERTQLSSKQRQKGKKQVRSKSIKLNSDQSEEEEEDGDGGSNASVLKKRKRSRNQRSNQPSQRSNQNDQMEYDSEDADSNNKDSEFSDTLSVDIKKKKKDRQQKTDEMAEVDQSITESSFMMLKVLGIEKLQGRMKKGEVRLDKVKAKIDNAPASQRQVVKIKPDENPIIAAIAQALNLGKQKLTPEHFICMVPAQIWSIMDQMMQDKVYFDLENENGPVSERAPVSFPSFMYDTMLMQYGLYQISIKMLMQLTNGLKTVHIKEPFGFMLNQVLGLADQKLRIDEVQIIIRAHTFFKLIQSSWIQKTRTNYKYLEITDQNESNFLNGGDCLIFDILQGVSSAFSSLPELKDKIASTLKPDILLKKNPDKYQQQLEFTVLKITNKIAKIGKDVKTVYNEWDKDGNQLLEPSEVLTGIKKNLNISLTREEANQFINYIDADKSGQIDQEEFTSKINLKDYQKRSHVYLISEKTFIEQILSVWYEYRAAEKEKLSQFILTFDDNGDRVIQFDEFQNLMQNLEPKITDQKIVSLYKKTLLIANKKEGEGLNDEICFKTLADVIMLYKLGGYGKEFFGSYLESKRSIYKELKKNKKK